MNLHYRKSSQFSFGFDELIVDNFAGGGGASTGIEMAIGRSVDIAINHDHDAIEMHKINHPTTRHYCESVWNVNPLEATQGRPVGLAWFSPDCKHFSKAKGGTPVNKDIRGLAWVALRWAAMTRPRIIMLENVEEFVTWGPLVAMRCQQTGRVIKQDGTMTLPGERTSIDDQRLVPDKRRKGKTYRSFIKSLRSLGYHVEWKTLIASDFGAPTIRKRFFLIARCDGQPIVWPQPTHGDPKLTGFKKSGLKKWQTAADIIDWTIPCPSIFDRKKPLAENTLRRIARGIERYVVNNPNPFIVRIGQQGFGGDGMQYELNRPLTTVTTKAEHCLVMPHITKYYGMKSDNESRGGVLAEPLATQTTENRFGLVSAFLTKFRTGAIGSSMDEPLPTATAGSFIKRPGSAAHAMGMVTTHLLHLRNNCDARSVELPLPTITAGGGHVGEVRAFLIKYYTTGSVGQSLDSPIHTITSKDRLGLVVVHGELYQIVDICMRMLEPHELFAATSFPANYIIDRDASGNSVPKYKQVARCGNAVPPLLAQVLVQANYCHLQSSIKVA